ncbi:hypothetical protein EMPS_10081 [Entomortierella parvispora]|uniref:RRM domain-containing protein n=1 Tax=Entomortierella parvispora TaxID=205924 RepID=A0A9P3M0Z6_9FUNG|nr:hypothetical protein EMPS_10081 [Entomortierella parvispora]
MSDRRPTHPSTSRFPGSTSVLRPVPVPKPKPRHPTLNQDHFQRRSQHASTSAHGTRNAPYRPLQGHGSRPLLSENAMNEAFGRMGVNDAVTLPRSVEANKARTRSRESNTDIQPPPVIESVNVNDLHTIHEPNSPPPPLPASRVELAKSPLGYAKDRDEQSEEKREDVDYQEQAMNEPQACLFVASLAASKTDTELAESVTRHFERWGTLRNVKVLKDWMQRPYSFVQFERVEDAQRAMAEAQNTIVDGRHIRIEQARVNRTLFIQRFTRETTEQDLKMYLEEFGPLEEVNIFHDRGFDHRFRRYAFAKFSYRDDAIKAYVSLKASSRWSVEWASNLSKQNQVEKESVFVGQLNPEEATEEKLRTRFQEYGHVKKVSLIKRTNALTDRVVAFAFIEFDNEQSARSAIEHANSTQFLGSEIYVQHRETTEFRSHRQQVAMQVSRAPLRRPAANSADYSRQYGYPGPMAEDVRPVYYSAYFPYPPPMMPVPINSGASPAVYQGHQPPQQRPAQSTAAVDPVQAFYSPYVPMPAATDHFGPSADSQAQFDYSACIQTPEGLFYPHTVPPLFYVYDQGQFAAMGPGTAGVPTSSVGVPVGPFVSSNWYMSPRPMPPPPWANMRPPPQAGGASAPDQVAASSAARPPALDPQGQSQKAA